jgi:hypothetical protein
MADFCFARSSERVALQESFNITRVAMLGRLGLGLGALVLTALGVGCATAVSVTTTGGDGGATGTGGSPGVGGAMVDAGVDVMVDSGPQGPCVTAEDCAFASDTCNVGTCINGACQKTPVNEFGGCNDGLFCTENDVCQSGKCVGGPMKSCPASGSCNVGTCDEAAKACKSAPGNDGDQCDDNDPCTLAGVCVNGTCSKGSPIDCSVFNGPCSVGTCDPMLGCKPSPLNDGSACDDGMSNPCSTGQCMQGNCQPVAANEGGPCSDNLFCTVNDHCQNSVCVGGGPNPCAPPGGCYIASCDEFNQACTAVPGNDGAACDDFNTCTKNTTCLNGACINGVADNDGAMCDDSSTCTSATTCSAGVCGGGVGPTVYFADDFHDNSKGWLLGPEWQIGPAMASQGGAFGADPATDHSPSSDNGVAGVVIGGNENPVVHGYYYIESPPFDTSTAAGSVILGFQRWLNSDYDPFMHNRVEVYNGSQWIVVWMSGPSPGIQDSPPSGLGWTFQQFDLTAYKNTAMKVRFGYDIGQSGVYTIGSWNLDDVLVASGACP